MRRENKEVIIDSITNLLNTSANLYVTDLEALNAEKTSQLRRLCFNSQVKLVVVKNALLKKAMERTGKLRKASGRSTYPMIRRYLNGETRQRKPLSACSEYIAVRGEPGELKHLSTRRKRKKIYRFPK